MKKKHPLDDLDADIRDHLERETAENIERGMSPDEAQAAARRAFGRVTIAKENTRAVWVPMWLQDLLQDLRCGLRQLRRNAGFAAAAILTLALGIGANTAIFSLLDAVMLRTLPVEQPNRLVEITELYPGEALHIAPFSWSDYERMRDVNHVFSDLLGVSFAPFDVGDGPSSTRDVQGAYVSGNYFSGLGLRPAVGRFIGPRDEARGATTSAVVVLSWAYWNAHFDHDPAVVDRTITMNSIPTTIIGVAPPEFIGLEPGAERDVWVPIGMEPLIDHPSRLLGRGLIAGAIGRLMPGVTIEQARAEVGVVGAWWVEQVAKSRPDPLLRQMKLGVQSAAGGFSILRDHFDRPLVAVMALAGLLLLLTCCSVASMLVARGAARQREMSVRAALGATRFRLTRQVLTESLLLAGGGTAIGAALGSFGSGLLLRLLTSGRGWPEAPAHLQLRIGIDVRMLLFVAGITLLAAVLFGVVPAWRSLEPRALGVRHRRGLFGRAMAGRAAGRTLVILQVAMSIVLLSAAVRFVDYLSDLRTQHLGFEPTNVLIVKLDPTHSRYTHDQIARAYQDLLGRLQQIPGISSATLSGVTPIEGPGAADFVEQVEGIKEDPQVPHYVDLNWIGPKYFRTFGTPLAGRDFRFDDERQPRVAIVNEAMARRYFGARNPLGRHFRLLGNSGPYEVIGVAADQKYMDLHAPSPPMVYFNTFQEGRGISNEFALKTTVPPASVIGEVRREMHERLSTVPIARMTTMPDQLNASLVPERTVALLAGFFSVLGALLAALGLYGLLAWTVARRTSEIGVRVALGAGRGCLLWMVLRDALVLVLAGFCLGCPLAVWSRTFAARIVQGSPGGSLLPIALSAAVMIAAALLAAYIPARRALRIDPAEALRCE